MKHWVHTAAKRDIIKYIDRISEDRDKAKEELKRVIGTMIECRAVRDFSNIMIADLNRKCDTLIAYMEKRKMYPDFPGKSKAMKVYKSRDARWDAIMKRIEVINSGEEP